MMQEGRLYAVITGDVVGSSKLEPAVRHALLDLLAASFATVDECFGPMESRFAIYRGDSFQGVLSNPRTAMHAALLLRASIRAGLPGTRFPKDPDVYLAVGIGTISSLPEGQGAMGDGEAFRRSGPALDDLTTKGTRAAAYAGAESHRPYESGEGRSMSAYALADLKSERRTAFRTPWPEADHELSAECALLDAIANRWSGKQAEALSLYLRGSTQESIGKRLGIRQPSVASRLQAAQAWAVGALLVRYERLLARYIEH